MKEFELNRIKQIIEEKFNWGPSVDWTNYHFKELKKAIKEATGNTISEETLKRIFGKRKVSTKNYQPQAYTKITLIKFVESIQPSSPLKEVSKHKLTKTWLIAIIAVILLTISVLVYLKRQKTPEFIFICNNPVQLSPFTARFNYDVSDIKDSVFVHTSFWNEVYLSPDNSMINFSYTSPGVYDVILYTRSKVLDKSKILAYSSDWEGGYYPNRADSLYVPFLNQDFYRHDDVFYADPDPLLNEEGVVLKDRYYTSYRLYSPFNKSLDSLSLETSVLNNASTGTMMCYDTGIQLIGDSGIIEFNFTQLNCQSFAGLQVSEKVLSGQDTDLSPLSVEMSNWLNIEVVTENNEFNLYLDDQLIYEQSYEKPLGNLIGIIYYFFGTGQVDDLKVFDQEHDLFYSYDFNSHE